MTYDQTKCENIPASNASVGHDRAYVTVVVGEPDEEFFISVVPALQQLKFGTML